MRIDNHPVHLGVVILASLLCGCASSKLMVPKAEKSIPPGMARIHFKRAYSIVGAAAPMYLLDGGTGIKYDAVMGAGAGTEKPKADKRAFDINEYALTQEKPGIAKCIALHGPKPQSAVVTDPVTGMPKAVCQHRNVVGGESYVHDAGAVSGRANVALIGKIGPGGTLTWDRPPGVAKFHVDFAIQTSSPIPIEAGKEYRVIFHYVGNSFELKEVR